MEKQNKFLVHVKATHIIEDNYYMIIEEDTFDKAEKKAKDLVEVGDQYKVPCVAHVSEHTNMVDVVEITGDVYNRNDKIEGDESE